jgi:hypothetical protein
MKRCGLAAPIAARQLFQEIPNLFQEPRHPGILSTKIVILHRQGDEPRTCHSHDSLFG